MYDNTKKSEQYNMEERRVSVLTRSGRKEEEEEEALLVSLLCRTMQGNTISA